MAKKRGPLSKVEAFYVLNNYPNIDAATIAIDLDRPISTVENYIKKHVIKNKELNAVNASEHFVRQSGATIMTENASTIGDAIKGKVAASRKGCITKIRADE